MADKKKKPPMLKLDPTSQPAHNTDSPDGGGFAVDTTSKECVWWEGQFRGVVKGGCGQRMSIVYLSTTT